MLQCPTCTSPDMLPIVYGDMTEIVTDLLITKRIRLGSTLREPDDRALWYCTKCGTECGQRKDPNWDTLLTSYLATVRDLWSTYQGCSDQERSVLLSRDALEKTIIGFLIYNACSILQMRLMGVDVQFRVTHSGSPSAWIPFPDIDSEVLRPSVAAILEYVVVQPTHDSAPFLVSVAGKEYRVLISRKNDEIGSFIEFALSDCPTSGVVA